MILLIVKFYNFCNMFSSVHDEICWALSIVCASRNQWSGWVLIDNGGLKWLTQLVFSIGLATLYYSVITKFNLSLLRRKTNLDNFLNISKMWWCYFQPLVETKPASFTWVEGTPVFVWPREHSLFFTCTEVVKRGF